MGDILEHFTADIKENVRYIENLFEDDCILRKREFSFGGSSACLFYFDGMVNVELINESVLKPLGRVEKIDGKLTIADFTARTLFASEIKVTSLVKDGVSAMLYGDTLLLLENSRLAITVNSKGWRTRGISEPQNERVLEGPREGFDEAAMFNVAMIRRRLQTPDFACEMTRMGRATNTVVFICYLKSLVNRATLRELKKQLDNIDIDGVLDSNYLTEQITRGGALFRKVGSTERPDVVAARLLEGRVAVVVDTTPMVITLPYLFSENFQSDEDYYISPLLASAGRFMRMLCFVLSVSVSAIYLALTTHHFDFLPSEFALTVSVARSGVPFPSVFECLILTLIFEILRETGIRMPQNVGHALSIVGGLVVGQSAVEARLVSAPMLIAVAFSGICGLMVPRLSSAVFFLRFGMIISSAVFGLFGILCLSAMTLIHLLSVDSFGTDATSALRNPSAEGLKDVPVRVSWRKMFTRPPIQSRNVKRKK